MTTPMHQIHTVTLTAEGVDYSYEIRRLHVLKVASLNLRIASTILPLFSGLKLGMGDDMAAALAKGGISGLMGSAIQFDGGKAIEAIVGSLEKLDEETLTKLLCDLFSTTSVVFADGTKAQITASNFSACTGYDMGLVLRLAVEVVEFCKFPFIGARAKSLIGYATRAIAGLDKQTSTDGETPDESQKAEK